MAEKTRLLIIGSEDSENKLEALLSNNGQFEVVVRDIYKGVRDKRKLDPIGPIEEYTPDAAVVDDLFADSLSLHTETPRIIRRICENFPELPILAIAQKRGNIIDDYVFALSCICSGAEGYIMENGGIDGMDNRANEAIQALITGRYYPNDEELVSRVDGLGEFMENLRKLSRTEQKVFLLKIIKKASDKWVAKSLHRSVRTVEVHLGNIYRKLNVDDVNELMVYGTLAVFSIIGKYNINNYNKPVSTPQ